MKKLFAILAAVMPFGCSQSAEPESDAWVYADPPNTEVFTTKQVVEGELIVYVSHDADDGAWQMLSASEVPASDARLVALSQMLEHDPTLKQVMDLPRGWIATRDDIADAWVRQKAP